MTISPGHGIKLDLPNYAPGLAVIPIDNPEEARHYARLRKSRPYRMALTIGFCLLLAACSQPQISENIEQGPQPKTAVKDIPAVVAAANDGLSGFYTALARLENGQRLRPVVIVHLGDSHIAADRFSGDLRQRFQRRFGDAGRGLVQPGKAFKYFNARGVSTQQSQGWKAANSFLGDTGPYSLTGVRLEVASAGEILKLTVKKPNKRQEIEVAFLTGPGAGSVEVKAEGKTQELDLTNAKNRIQRFKIRGQSLSVKTLDARPVSVLGWSSYLPKPGVRYVSLGLPGASAIVMTRWDKSLVKAELKYLKPDLIILGYGTNEGFRDDLNATAYQQRFEALAAALKRAANNPSLLVLGAPDSTRLPKYAQNQQVKPECRALSKDEVTQYSTLLQQKSQRLARWHAPPGLARVRAAQKRAAQNLNAAYWDWSQVMGGECGTFRWARANPALAYGDNVHFNDAGSKRAAVALYRFLMKGYGQFS